MNREFRVNDDIVEIVEDMGCHISKVTPVISKKAFQEAFKKFIIGDLEVRIKLLYSDSQMPVYGTEGSMAVDVFAHERATFEPGETVLVGTGIALASDIPASPLMFPRSGLSSKKGLTLANCTGLIDNDYRGELKVALHNIGWKSQVIEKGERIAQLMFVPRYLPKFKIVEELDETERGDGGFGHTGTTDIMQ